MPTDKTDIPGRSARTVGQMSASTKAIKARTDQARPKIVEPRTVVIVPQSSASSGLPLICIATKASQHAPDASKQPHVATATRGKRLSDEAEVRSLLPGADTLFASWRAKNHANSISPKSTMAAPKCTARMAISKVSDVGMGLARYGATSKVKSPFVTCVSTEITRQTTR